MFDISSWGQRIVDENELEGARWRWELYQGEEGRQHYELDRQAERTRSALSSIGPALQDAISQIAEAFRPLAQAVTDAVRDLADLLK